MEIFFSKLFRINAKKEGISTLFFRFFPCIIELPQILDAKIMVFGSRDAIPSNFFQSIRESIVGGLGLLSRVRRNYNKRQPRHRSSP